MEFESVPMPSPLDRTPPAPPTPIPAPNRHSREGRPLQNSYGASHDEVFTPILTFPREGGRDSRRGRGSLRKRESRALICRQPRFLERRLALRPPFQSPRKLDAKETAPGPLAGIRDGRGVALWIPDQVGSICVASQALYGRAKLRRASQGEPRRAIALLSNSRITAPPPS